MPVRAVQHQVRLGSDLLLAGWEYLGRQVAAPYLLTVAPRAADQKAVITLPGFTGNERSLAGMNQLLNGLGYLAEPWKLGRNRGYFSPEQLETQVAQIARHVRTLADRTGHSVALVGHSLGGIYAREVARRHPGVIARVITLGSPAHLGTGPGGVNAHVRSSFARSRGAGFQRASRDEPPAGVPLVSVYSPLDAVVSVAAARIPEAHQPKGRGVPRENVEVASSHLGMTVNPVVQLIVADRLAEPLGSWRPFNPGRYLLSPFTFVHRPARNNQTSETAS